MTNVVIAGSRDFTDYKVMHDTLYPLFERFKMLEPDATTIISGAARGADTLGERFAKDNDLGLKRMPADWNQHGRSAGHIRNRQMLDLSDSIICFWDESSKGTKGMIDITIKSNKPYLVYNLSGELLYTNIDNLK